MGGSAFDVLWGRPRMVSTLGELAANLVLVLLLAAGAVAASHTPVKAQPRSTDAPGRFAGTAIGEGQRQLIEQLEARAAAWADGKIGSSKYWAYIEANLSQLRYLERQTGERMTQSPPFQPVAPDRWPDEGDASYRQAMEARVRDLKSGERIFGGEKAQSGQFREVVSLAVPVCSDGWCSVSDVLSGKSTLTSFSSFCSGTLVSKVPKKPAEPDRPGSRGETPHIVLTASHCLCNEERRIEEDEFAVVFGTALRDLKDVEAAYQVVHSGMKKADEPRTEPRSAQELHCKESHKASQQHGSSGDYWAGRDLSMVQLGGRLSRTVGGKAVAVGTAEVFDPPVAAMAGPALLFSLLPDAPNLFEVSNTSAQRPPGEVVLVGFGYSEQILGVKHDSQKLTGTKFHTRARIRDAICQTGSHGCKAGKEMIVVGNDPIGYAARADTCSGDSGGPVFLLDKASRRYLVAATSRSSDSEQMKAGFENYERCGSGGIYSLTTRQAVKWLHQTLRANLIVCDAPGFCGELRD